MIELIKDILAPAIVISACGLLCLAQFARYTAIQGRIRSFSADRLRLLRELHAGDCWIELVESRLLHLEEQCNKLCGHLNMIKLALGFLVGCILGMILCSLMIGASYWLEDVALTIAGIFFGLGMLSLLVGMVLVLVEVSISLSIIHDEHEEVTELTQQFLKKEKASMGVQHA